MQEIKHGIVTLIFHAEVVAAHILLCILLLNKNLLDFLGKIYGLKGIFVKEIIEISFIKVSWHSLLSYNTQFCVYKILDRSSNYAEKNVLFIQM